MERIATARFRVYGIVQGVGFRPTVDRHASTSGIRGSVCNKGPYVEIFAQGTQEQIAQFETLLREQPPRRSSILKIDKKEVADAGEYDAFSIVESEKTEGEIFISPDIAICEDCIQELYDPSDRRYMHPFINCTCCGPRLTILDALPYDRERTSMKMFPMCKTCAEEYYSPLSRRYDAQPVCCNECGPEVYLLPAAGTKNSTIDPASIRNGSIDLTENTVIRGREAITAARQKILDGGIVAVKGIGGFHLCCDAANEEAVHSLRVRKRRPAKPFAVMMKDEETVRRECLFNEEQRQILIGHQKPILLLDRNENNPEKILLAPSVAPGNPKVGVMLPYAPLQLLLFAYNDGLEMPDCLIMTSGNVSGAPICRDDRDALTELSGFCDCILSHNRLIRIRADDTVMDFHEGHPYMIRRSRGYAPLPVLYAGENNGTAPEKDSVGNPDYSDYAIDQNSSHEKAPDERAENPDYFAHAMNQNGSHEKAPDERAENPDYFAHAMNQNGSHEKAEDGSARKEVNTAEMKGCVLAVGGELKNTFCIASGNLFYLSPYVGDLEDLRTVRALEETIGRMEKLLEVTPKVVVCDLHPKYNATSVAEEIAGQRGLPILRIQHHYAHVLSCMAENDRRDPVIGVSFDGTGFGEDGTIWGGEILIADAFGYERARSIAPFLQIGGDSAPRQGWRIAASMIRESCERELLKSDQAPGSGDAAKDYFEIIEKLSICDLQNAKAQRMMAERGIQAVISTSAGRLFDSVSAMLGICRESTYEGEASIELEFAAERYAKKRFGDPLASENIYRKANGAGACEELRLQIRKAAPEQKENTGNALQHLPTDLLFAALLRERLGGEDPEKLAWLFHAGLAELIVESVLEISAETGITATALTGGCFQNRLLLTLVQDSLTERGMEVLIHHLVPPNDGGIALGQALAAMCRIQS